MVGIGARHYLWGGEVFAPPVLRLALPPAVPCDLNRRSCCGELKRFYQRDPLRQYQARRRWTGVKEGDS
ncbi:hypothetical protein E2C01_022912 [Portunus trituberculatus]|uniref:Uncharacterized protein n=1 Tax=Portunus trituberculatus TaxID=210409 RepID=A0A5B7E8J4_PORTR|nr:hypothetical protein [Portunus trituberculatus]